ncbi:GMC family oxidoreductase [Tellurirhabdus rosea]|uniref:GMC family oxidoreductase n=1 Tax=Tellurirhabdus rosea TaxID=2674997 RepID=UPI00224F6591|nr:GMC family oxidoreductase N-terminal domain-containing protein [Tellurirhabdus rosea]
MKYDYILVGAGSAGCVLAHRLTADPGVSVLLLEAGGPDTKPEIHIPAAYTKLNRTSVDWGYWTEPQAHVDGRMLYLPRGKTLGGSSSTNAMAYVRGNALDYDDWAALGNEGWGYQDVLPYFLRSEHNEQIDQLDPRYHGTDGPMNVTFATRFRTPLAGAFVNGCKAIGIRETNDFNGIRQEGAGFFQFTIRNGRRESTATAFLKPILNRPNLTVRTKVYTRRVLLENGRATGVEVITSRNVTEKIYARREVILSAGSFNSPQILMLSGIGPAEMLRPFGIETLHELPGVGQNLQDHLFTGASALTSGLYGTNHYLRPLYQFQTLLQYFATRQGPATISPLEANAFIRTDETKDRPDLQLHFAPTHIGDDYKGDLYDINTFPRTDGFTILPTLLKPQSRGYVRLRSANPIDVPVIQPNFLSAEADRNLLLKGMKIALEIMETDAFGPYRERTITPPDRSSDEAILAHILRQVETVYHPVGTCKMGNDEMAVVDAKLRVRGLEGLRVIDASIMPTIVSGNTNAAAIMIGEKGADLVMGVRQKAREVMSNE